MELEVPGPVRRQGEGVNCCTSIAVVTCMEILYARIEQYVELSPLYNYFKARAGGPAKVLTLYNAVDSAVRDGVATQKTHHTPNPITADAARKVPDDSAIDTAELYKIYSKRRGRTLKKSRDYLSHSDEQSVEEWKDALNNSHPIAIGILLGEAYKDLKNENCIYRPEVRYLSREKGHAVTVVGMDEEKMAFRILDSQGEDFCEDGRWWLPYDMIYTGLVTEAVAITGITYKGG